MIEEKNPHETNLNTRRTYTELMNLKYGLTNNIDGDRDFILKQCLLLAFRERI